MKLNWGFGVAAVYVAFASATTMVVVFAMRQPVDLVSADYYAQGLRQDQRARALENVRDLGTRVRVTRTGAERVSIEIPPEQAASARGQITLYRASDARADRLVDLAVDTAGRQSVSIDGLAIGRWSVRIEWNAGGRDFYFETPLVID